MSGETPWTAGPWSTEAFNEVIAGTPDYGAMILGADGETIVAQCVAERDLPLLLAAPVLYGMLLTALDYVSDVAEGGAVYLSDRHKEIRETAAKDLASIESLLASVRPARRKP